VVGTGMPQFRHVGQQARRYFGAVGWLFGLVVRQHRGRVALVFAGSAAGVTLVGAGLGGVFAVVSSLESGNAVRLARLQFGAGDERSVLAIAAFSSLLILAGAVTLYVARSVSIGVAKDVLGRLSADTLATYGGIPPHPLAFRSDRHLQTAVNRIRSGAARKGFLVVRNAFDLPVHLLTFVGGIAVLVWLQPRASLVAMALLLTAAPVYYLVNRNAVKMTKRFEALARPSAREARALLETYARRPHDPHADVRVAVAAAPATREREEAFAHRFLATVRTVFTSQVLGGLAFLSLLAYMSTQYFAGRLSIAELAAFMLVLRFVLNAVSATLRSFALVSRFYPAIYRLHLYQTGQGQRRALPPDTVFRLRLMKGGLREPGTPRRTWALNPGDVVGVNAPVGPSRYTVWYFASLLAPAGNGLDTALAVRDHTSVVVIPPPPETPTSLRAHFGIAAEARFEDVLHMASDGAREALAAASFDSLDEMVQPDAIEALPRATAAQLALAAAILENRPVIVMYSKYIPSDIGQRLPDRLTVSVHQIPPQRDFANVHAVAASDATVVAWGSARWVRENWPAIKELRNAYEDELTKRYADEATDEDEGDEEGA